MILENAEVRPKNGCAFRILRTLGRVGTLVLATATPVVAGTAAEYYEDAVRAIDRADRAKALIQLRNAVQQDNAHLPARILLGRTLLQEGTPAEAEQELLLARGLNADLALLDPLLARAYLAQGKYRELVDRIDPWSHPDEVAGELFVLRGRSFFALGDTDSAQRMFEEARRHIPGHAEATLELARLRLGRGDNTSARKELAPLFAAGSAPAEAYFVLGRIEEREHNPDQAIAAYGSCLALDPGHLPARLRRVALLIDRERLGAAQADLDQARTALPFEPMVDYLQGLIHARAGRLPQAEEALTQALERIQSVDDDTLATHAPTLLLAGAVAYLLGNLDQARMYLGSYLGSHPDHEGARRRLADILLQQDKPEDALNSLQPLAERRADDPRLMVLMARAHRGLGNYPEAAELLRRAVRLAPHDTRLALLLADSEVHAGKPTAAARILEGLTSPADSGTRTELLIGYLQLRSGQTDKASDRVRAILDREPDNLDAAVLMGAVHLVAGRRDAARAMLSWVVEKDPANLAAQLNLARLDMTGPDLQAAGERLQRLQRQHPADLEVLGLLADWYTATGAPEKAVRLEEEMLRRHPRSLESRLALIQAYLNAGRAQRALDLSEQLQGANPDRLSVLDAVGRSELAAGRGDMARITFRRMSTMASYDTDALLRIATLQARAGDARSAYWSLSKAVKGDPKNLEARYRLGLAECDLDKLDAAAEQARTLQQDFPREPHGALLEGRVENRRHRPGAAADAFSRAQALAPGTDTLIRLFRAQRDAGRTQQAIANLERWLDAHPDDPRIQRLYASVLARSGRLEDARTAYERLVHGHPEDAGLLNDLALIQLALHDPQSLPLAHLAYAAAPGDPVVADTLGWVLVGTGEAQQGLPYLREAQSRLSREPEIRYHVAAALAALDRTGEAVDTLQVLLDQDVAFESRDQARALLARLRRRGTPDQ